MGFSSYTAESDMTEVAEHARTSERACLGVWGRIHLNDA